MGNPPRWYQRGIKKPPVLRRGLAILPPVRLTYAEFERADERTRTADLLITNWLMPFPPRTAKCHKILQNS
jgi:hypothetical protein